jgi:hypothetical protein
VNAEKDRKDHYLVFPGCDSVSVKLRDGMDLEIKAITAFPRSFHLDSGIGGRADQWVKYSIKRSEVGTLDNLLAENRWVTVQKRRYLRRFSAESDDITEVSVSKGAFLKAGCNVELTEVKVDSTLPYWLSLGLEAWGPPSDNEWTLFAVLSRFFHSLGPFPICQLTGRDSLSYPAWLATLS